MGAPVVPTITYMGGRVNCLGLEIGESQRKQIAPYQKEYIMFFRLDDYCNLVKKRFIIRFHRLLWKLFHKKEV